MIPLEQIFSLDVLTRLAGHHSMHPGLLWEELSSAANAYTSATVGKDKNMEAMKREMELLAQRLNAFATELEKPRVQSWLSAEAVELARRQGGNGVDDPDDEEAAAREALVEAGELVQSDVGALRRLATLAESASRRDLEPTRLAMAKRQAAAGVLVRFWTEGLNREPVAAIGADEAPSPLVAFVYDCLAPMGAVRTPGECLRVLQSMQQEAA